MSAKFYYDASSVAVATPTFSPAGGEYTEAQSVAITCETEGATIYYTLDGTTPTDESIVYTQPLTISETTTVKAIAYDVTGASSAVVSATYTIIDPNGPGTENNPYTVAQARDAIDAGTGVTGVYATGIVSAIPTAYSTQYSNITFNMVDAEGDEVFLQAYRCGGDEAADVQVGDIAVVYGNLTKYNTTYEFGQGCQLVSLTHPVITTPYFTAEDVEIAWDATDGAIEYTVNNPVDGGVVSAATTEDSWLMNIQVEDASVTFNCDPNQTAAARTATITLTYSYDNETVTKEVTVTQAGNPNIVNAISEITEVGTQYAVRGTVVATNSRGFVIGDGTGYVYTYLNAAPSVAVGDKVSVSGTTGTYGQIIQFTKTATISEATESNYNGTPAAVVLETVPTMTSGSYSLSTYWQFEGTLAVDGSNYLISFADGSSMQVSYPTTDQQTALTALDGKTVQVRGYFAGINSSEKYTIMLESVEEVESNEASITVDPTEVNVVADGGSGTITVTAKNLAETGMKVVFCDANGGLVENGYDWFYAEISEEDNVFYVVEANEGEARTAYMKVYGLDANAGDVYSELITINQAASVEAPVAGVGAFVKVTSPNDLTSGSYLIVYEDGAVAFNGGLETLDAANNTIGVSIANNKIAANTTTVASVFAVNMTDGTLKSVSGKYIGQTGNTNGLQAGDTKYTNKISIDEDGNADIVSGGAYLRYNFASNQVRFRYYKSSSYTNQKAIQLYKYDKDATYDVEAVTVTAAGLATYVSDNDLDYSSVDGLQAYIALVDGSNITFTKVEQVPAGQGVLLRAMDELTEAATFDVPVTENASQFTANAFVRGTGMAVASEADGVYNYILNVVNDVIGFYQANNQVVAKNRAYLQTQVQASRLSISFEGDETTGIAEISTPSTQRSAVYDLQGRRVENAVKGLYIVNGKKMVK